MPNCFTLTKKGETEPTTLNKLDEEICEFLGEPVDPVHYVADWYNTIGLMLACGKTLPQCKEIFTHETTHKIVDFLDEHYVAHAWYEVRDYCNLRSE